LSLLCRWIFKLSFLFLFLLIIIIKFHSSFKSTTNCDSAHFTLHKILVFSIYRQLLKIAFVSLLLKSVWLVVEPLKWTRKVKIIGSCGSSQPLGRRVCCRKKN
jgi:hypothetical protein